MGRWLNLDLGGAVVSYRLSIDMQKALNRSMMTESDLLPLLLCFAQLDFLTR